MKFISRLQKAVHLSVYRVSPGTTQKTMNENRNEVLIRDGPSEPWQQLLSLSVSPTQFLLSAAASPADARRRTSGNSQMESVEERTIGSSAYTWARTSERVGFPRNRKLSPSVDLSLFLRVRARFTTSKETANC